jgi:hypothetical protein
LQTLQKVLTFSFHAFPLCFFPRRWSSNITSLLHCTLHTLQKYRDIMCRAISELAAFLLEPLIRGSLPPTEGGRTCT